MFCEDMDELNYMERVFVDQTWIDRHDTYNLVLGGGSVCGLKHSKESLMKMSEAHKGNTAHLGHHHSEEAKRKMSERHKGKTLSDETRMKMSESRKRECISDETLRKRSEGLHRTWRMRKESGEEIKSWNKGKTGVYSNETLKKMSEAKRGKNRGKHWYNNGVISVFSFECPPGYYLGRIYNRKIHEKGS